MKKYYLLNLVLIIVIIAFSSITYAYYVKNETTSDFDMTTGKLVQELSINNEPVVEEYITISQLVFFDLLVDLNESNAEMIFNDSVCKIDIAIKNIESIPFTVNLSVECDSLIVFLLTEVDDNLNYYDVLMGIINNETNLDQILINIDNYNQSFIDSFALKTFNENTIETCRVVTFGYQPDPNAKNEDFLFNNYNLKVISKASQVHGGID